jgi:hypothetical protein
MARANPQCSTLNYINSPPSHRGEKEDGMSLTTGGKYKKINKLK